MGIQKREHCSLNDQGEITQKVCKQELSFLYETHLHDLFYITVKCHDNKLKGIYYITVKCHDNIPKGYLSQSGHEIASETIKGK